jgi:hypothetical protein
MNKPKKLNIFQQGILNSILFWTIGIVCLMAMGAIFYLIGKYNFFKDSATPAIDAVGVAVIMTMITVALLMASLRLNLSWKVILSKAIEFTAAMRKLGLFDFDTQLAFAAAHNLHIFVANKPLLHDFQENVPARRYLFLAHKKILSSHKGEGTLCLDADDYERIARETQTPFSVMESAAIAEKDKIIATLQADLLGKTSELATLAEENSALREECEELKGRDQTASARAAKLVNLHANRVSFWMVAVPLINRLRREAVADDEYTKEEIQAQFERELEDYPAFKPAIKDILDTDKKRKENTPFSLEGWAMRAIWNALREYGVKVKTTPGPKVQK